MGSPPVSDSTRAEFESLAREIVACRRCPLGSTRANAVVYRGSLRPRIVFVGEAPGAEEDRVGLPFVGRSGRILDTGIARLGLAPTEFGILNVLKCRPPSNRFDRSAAATCRPYLDRQVALLRPDLLVSLGAWALRALDPDAPPILKTAGVPRRPSLGSLFPLVHPAATLRSKRLKARWEHDLDALASHIRGRPGLKHFNSYRARLAVRTLELFLLGGSYQAVDDGVVVELYGRTRDGVATVARYYGFRPYFVLLEPTPEIRERLSKDAEVVGVDETTTWVGGRDRPAIRVTLHRPWLVPQYRDAYRQKEAEPSVLSCDIPFVHRFLYDKHLGLVVAFEAEDEPEEVRARYTVPGVVRVVTTEGHEIRPTEPFRPSLRVLSFDIENAIRETDDLHDLRGGRRRRATPPHVPPRTTRTRSGSSRSSSRSWSRTIPTSSPATTSEATTSRC